LNSEERGHLTPSQTVELNPTPYEIYALMQHACSHLMKLNDFLRADAFLKKNFVYPEPSNL
jgi:hypothetical protein